MSTSPPQTPTPTPTDMAIMELALKNAEIAAALGEVPVGAAVYRTATGELLSQAHNLRHTQKDPTAHAELLALRLAAIALGDWRLSDCTLVVTLEPCPMCAGAIVNARVGRVVFGCADPKAGACGSLMSLTTDPRLNHRVTPIPGVLGDRCAAILKAFFQSRRA